MKILITIDWYMPAINGVVTSVMNLKTGLEKRGHEVKVLTLEPKTQLKKEDGIYYIKSLSLDRLYPKARCLRSLGRPAVRGIIKWQPDIVHSQCEFSTHYFAKKIAKELKVPLIHTYHTLYEDYTHYLFGNEQINKWWVKKFTKHILKHTHAVVAPTEKVKSVLMRYEVRPLIRVVPTGVSFEGIESLNDRAIDRLKSDYNIPNTHKILLYLGRLGKENNVQELIAYFTHHSPKNMTLLIVGDGPMKGSLEAGIDKGAPIVLQGKFRQEKSINTTKWQMSLSVPLRRRPKA